MSPTEYTLDDLVRATGFSKRQIRFYITKKLVPGAGGSRGPNAAYGEETLRRLRMIAVLKEKRIEPTGRAMTLDEIGHALDTLSAGGIEALLAGHAELAILDTESGVREPLGSAAEYLASVREPGPLFRRSDEAPQFEVDRPLGSVVQQDYEPSSFFHALRSDEPDNIDDLGTLLGARGGDIPRDDDLSDLLGRLQALLAELALDSRFTGTATDHPQWLRVTTPDVEFHVRKPDDHVARARLAAMAMALARLLEREE